MPQAVRRFLRPLVGIDPGEVRVHRGELAAEVTSARHADAVTVGRDVFLAPGQGGNEPRGLGLLAHELTHVARHGQPTFIPPVSGYGPLHGDAADEEGVATQVEATVRSAAASVAVGGVYPPGATTNADLRGGAASGATTVGPAAGAWDGLPAPWEPLPAWLTTPTSAQASAPLQSTSGATNGHAADNAAVPVHAPESAAVAVHAADVDRALPTTEDITADQPAEHNEAKAGAVEPDLDALARQVYTLLRRRMASERRRFN